MNQESQVKSLALPFVETLATFNKVVESSFGQKLLAGYKDDIENFSKSYMRLGITVSLKVRVYIFILKYLVKQTINIGTYCNQSLG